MRSASSWTTPTQAAPCVPLLQRRITTPHSVPADSVDTPRPASKAGRWKRTGIAVSTCAVAPKFKSSINFLLKVSINQKNRSNSTRLTDKPIGRWGSFRILRVVAKATVFLNDNLVIHGVTVENYWNRSKPIHPAGAIELQHHGDPLYFKNVYVREIDAKASTEWCQTIHKGGVVQ